MTGVLAATGLALAGAERAAAGPPDQRAGLAVDAGPAAGSLDTSFGRRGTVTLKWPGQVYSFGESAVVDPRTGKVVVVGDVFTQDEKPNAGRARAGHPPRRPGPRLRLGRVHLVQVR